MRPLRHPASSWVAPKVLWRHLRLVLVLLVLTWQVAHACMVLLKNGPDLRFCFRPGVCRALGGGVRQHGAGGVPLRWSGTRQSREHACYIIFFVHMNHGMLAHIVRRLAS